MMTLIPMVTIKTKATIIPIITSYDTAFSLLIHNPGRGR